MGDIPQPDSVTVSAIYGAYQRRNTGPRPYMGCSQIGEECDRALWYSFRWVKTIIHDGRLMRLFDRGNKEEPRMLADLRSIGVRILNTQEGITDESGHIKGHTDGTAIGLPEAPSKKHVLEFKTHSAKSFTDLRKLGVKLSKPVHYCQMQLYMHFTGIDRALYLAVNKDTDELYSERVRYDRDYAERQLARAQAIVFANEPPVKQWESTFYKCRFCDFSEICHERAAPERNCRTCLYAEPVEGGLWNCAKHGALIPLDEQRKRQECHRFIPALVGLEQIDVDGDTIVYEGWKDDGQEPCANS